MDIATALVIVGWAYAGVGLLFTVAFLIAGLRRVEPKAAGGSIAFHVLIAPGCIALWPVLLRAWLCVGGDAPGDSWSGPEPGLDTRSHRAWHQWIWLLLTPLIIAIIALALAYRQQPAVQPGPTSGAPAASTPTASGARVDGRRGQVAIP